MSWRGWLITMCFLGLAVFLGSNIGLPIDYRRVICFIAILIATVAYGTDVINETLKAILKQLKENKPK